MISLTVKPVDGETSVYGKNAEDLQENIEIGEDSITGTLKRVTEYKQFSSEPSEQSGNYLALSLASENGETIKTELVGGTKGEVTVDDGYCVYRISNKDSQSVKVTVTKGEESVTKTYSLEGLTCNES